MLTVGSDCAIGKKTVALELDLEARGRGGGRVFVPTGQTGVAIAGWGIAVDAVVADFIAGAAEGLVVEGARRGGELLLVEGQGALLHPRTRASRSGSSTAPRRTFVLCHQAGETRGRGLARPPAPPLAELIELYERIALPVRPARVGAIALNTRGSTTGGARGDRGAAEQRPGYPRATRCASARAAARRVVTARVPVRKT